MDAKLNQFAKVDDFERALILAQYAHEQDFRAFTGPELYQFIKARLDLTGLSNTAGLPEEFPEPNTTLEATNAGEWTVIGPGAYNKIVSGEINIADDEFAFAQFDGSDFNRVVRVKVPKQEGVDDLNPEGEDLPKEKAVAKYALERTSKRAFPLNYEVDEIDRPDLRLTDIITVDSEGRIMSDISDIDYSMLQNYSFHDYDRPDLGATVEVDSQNRIMSSSHSSGGGGNVIIDENYLLQHSKLYHEPAPVNEFRRSDFFVYSELLDKWDGIMSSANEGLFDYCIKTEVGKTSVFDLPIYTYEFKPYNPKIKVLVVSGMHGSEKIYVHLLSEYFDRLVKGWAVDSLLEWIRFNVHFIVVPLLSPSAYAGIAPATIGGRRVHETAPINVSWTKNGNDVTLTYDLSDFPDTGGRLDAATYFSNPNIAGKTWVSIFDSSQVEALPDSGYVIKSVVNGNTIIVDSGNALEESGTAKLYVGVDPNRNMQAVGSTVWNNFTPTPTSSTLYSNDWVANPNDNKGTKPFSLSETRILADLLTSNPDILFYVDLHSGAGNNYLNWSTRVEKGQVEAIEELKKHQSVYNSDGYSRVTQYNDTIPFSYKYSIEQIDRPGYCLEWEQVGTTTSKSATDAMRWLSTFFTSFFKHLK